MQLIRCFLIEDDTFALNWLIDLLETDFPEVQIVGTASSLTPAIRGINKTQPDLVLTDVELGRSTCFEVLDQLTSLDFGIIFITSFEKYALKAIKMSAIDYITKPVDSQSLSAAIAKFKADQRQSERIQNLLALLKKEKGARRIAIHSGSTIEFFELDHILYLEADANYSIIYLQNGRRAVASKTLKEFDQLLGQNDDFIRIHRSYLINKNKIGRLHRQKRPKITMLDGRELPVSRSRKVDFEKIMQLRP